MAFSKSIALEYSLVSVYSVSVASSLRGTIIENKIESASVAMMMVNDKYTFTSMWNISNNILAPIKKRIIDKPFCNK
jgi:hypothetical protein